MKSGVESRREDQQREADADAEEDEQRLAAPVAGGDQPLLQLAHLATADFGAMLPSRFNESTTILLVAAASAARLHRGAGDLAEPLLDAPPSARRERSSAAPRPAATQTGTPAAEEAASRYTSILMTLANPEEPDRSA